MRLSHFRRQNCSISYKCKQAVSGDWGRRNKRKKRNDVYKWMQCGIQYTVFVFVSLIKVLIESLINVECAFCSFRRKIKWSPQCLTLPVWFQHQALSANLYPSAGATEIFLVVLQIFCAMYISETFKMLPWKKKEIKFCCCFLPWPERCSWSRKLADVCTR